VRLRVDAKRHETTTDPGYFAALSAGSVRSLELQGGPYSVEEANEVLHVVAPLERSTQISSGHGKRWRILSRAKPASSTS
jgi:hypothetical protein